MVVYIVEQLSKDSTHNTCFGVYKDRHRAQQQKEYITGTRHIGMCIKTYPLMDMQNDEIDDNVYELQCKENNSCFIIGFYMHVENAQKAMLHYRTKFRFLENLASFAIVHHSV